MMMKNAKYDVDDDDDVDVDDIENNGWDMHTKIILILAQME